MRISWFSPLPPDHTDIAQYSIRVLPALEERMQSAIWTTTRRWAMPRELKIPVEVFDVESIDWKKLNLGGVPVYHIGNNIHYHGNIIRVARQCPGIVVLHDLGLHETVMNLCLYKGYGRPEYFDILYRFGGTKAVEMGRRFLDSREIDTNTLTESYPLFEYVLSNARGVITHNPLNVERVRAFTPAPVMYAPLPYLSRDLLRDPVDRTGKPPPYQIVLFGYLGSSNRRLRPFLEAFESCSSKDWYNIVIAGKYPEKEVRQWIKQLSLEKQVKTLGYLPESELESVLHDSDLCINLRWPTRGESSGTLLRIWNHSLPSIVTRTDYYSTVPQNAVAFVNPESEKQDLIEHLDKFAKDPDLYFKLGLSGRHHLENEHSAEAFSEFLESFLPVVEAARGLPWPQATGKSLVRNFITGYPDPCVREQLADRCAREIALWSRPIAHKESP